MWRSNYLFLVVIYIVRANDCPHDWTNVDNSCVVFMDYQTTWASASSLCEMQGAHLVSIHSELKNRLIINFLQNNNIKNSVWLSGTDALVEGHWVWTPSDQLMTYTAWESGHGDRDNNNDCLVIDMRRGGWHDRDCFTATYPFLCERPVSETIVVIG